MLDGLTTTLGLVAVAGALGTVVAGWGWRESRREGDQLEADLDGLRGELAAASAARARLAAEAVTAKGTIERLETTVRETAGRLQRSELWAKELEETRVRELGQARKELDEGRRAGEYTRRPADAARRDRARVAQEKQELEESRRELVADLRRLRAQATSTEAELAEHRRALRILGVRLDEGAHDPRAPERRSASLAVLRELVASTSVSAAALVDTQGLPHLAVGAASAVDRIAYAGGVLDELLPVLEANLQQPLALFTLADARAAVYLLRPGDDRRLLGVASSGGPPAPALRAAELRLRGRPAATPVYAELPGFPAEIQVARDPGLDDLVREWARRRGAEAVTIVDVGGAVRAAFGEVRPAAALLRSALAPLVARAVRDGHPLSTLELEARADRGTLTIRFARDAADAPCVVVRSTAPVPPAALDELCATLRWHRPLPAVVAAQGA